MTTALDSITDALQRIGVYAAGEVISAIDASQGLSTLNDMIDSWSNEALSVFARKEQSVTLVINQWQYTIGPGGNINGTRPLKLVDSPGSAFVLDTQGNRYPVQILNQDEWNLIGNISQVTANIISKAFYDPQYPLGILNVFPVPNQTWQFFFDSLLQLTAFATLTTEFVFPPGYRRAINTNLAIELWPYYKPDGAQPGAALVKAALESKGNIKRTNIKDVVAFYDPEIVSRASPTYNIYRDSQGAA